VQGAKDERKPSQKPADTGSAKAIGGQDAKRQAALQAVIVQVPYLAEERHSRIRDATAELIRLSHTTAHARSLSFQICSKGF
jgi:hypothetical protein